MQDQQTFQVMCDERRIHVEDNYRRIENKRSEMEQRLIEMEKRLDEAEKCMNETMEDQSLVEELCWDTEEKKQKIVADLLTFQQQMRRSEQIWSQEVGRLREQLMVQQQWLSTIALFKVSHTSAFGDFLNQCNEPTKSATITQALNQVIMDQKLGLRSYDGYDAESIGHVNNDLMRFVYGVTSFPFLESLKSSDRLMSFKEILCCLVDKDDDYQKVKDERLVSTIDLVSLGLVLASQALGLFEVIATTEPPPIEPKPEKTTALEEKPSVEAKVDVALEGAGKVDAGIVDQTLNKILVDFDPSLSKVGPSDVSS